MAIMKAVQIHAYGGPEVLQYEDAPRSEPGEGEVLVRVRAASVNPIDLGMRVGRMAQIFPISLPLTPGQDFAGVVEAVGAGADMAVGTPVFGATRIERAGAYAEYVATPAAFVAPMPATVSPGEAAAVPIAGLTAWQGLFDHAGLQAGQTVLVHGGSGGVGHFAVQFAKHAGARVISTASGANVDFVRKLGADEVWDYKTTRFEDVVQDVDVVFDTVGGETRDRSWAVLKPGGFLVSIVAGPREVEGAAQAHGKRGIGFHMEPNREQLAEVARLMESGAVRACIGATFPLSETRSAHERMEGGASTQGKIILEVSE